MLVKTSELSGAALDWAVLESQEPKNPHNVNLVLEGDFDGPYQYSTDWALAGPIIEREGIVFVLREQGWVAAREFWYLQDAADNDLLSTGPTPLIAAMRAYVQSAMGDEADVPEELL